MGKLQQKEGNHCAELLPPQSQPALYRIRILHEPVHFIYAGHSREFYDFFSTHMPSWKERKRILDYEVVLGDRENYTQVGSQLATIGANTSVMRLSNETW
ncbi:hypothetical protein V513_12340 [Mesotoga sp. H07.pep.5.3]|nr:hypothetical protein V513_12340 [Mesotoga sp. H07.pep.5.3]